MDDGARPGLSFTLGSGADLAEVRALLASCDLPHQDLEPHLAHLVVAREGGALVATAGVEPHGRDGLLRSVCVRPDRRGRGLAGAACDQVEAHARALGLRTLYLLTTTAERFFARRGYAPCARELAPPSLRASEEFRALCPASAVCMRRALAGGR